MHKSGISLIKKNDISFLDAPAGASIVIGAVCVSVCLCVCPDEELSPLLFSYAGLHESENAHDGLVWKGLGQVQIWGNSVNIYPLFLPL